MRALVCSTWLTASREILCESWTWRLISDTDEAISSAAAAADCALAEDCSDAEATVAERTWVPSPASVSCPAGGSSSAEAHDTVWTVRPLPKPTPPARRGDFRRCVLVVGLLDDVVDDGAVRSIARGDFSIGFRRRGAVALGECGQQTVLDRGPEAAHLAVGFLHQLGPEHRIEIGLA